MGEAMQAGIKQLWAGYVISDLRANLASGEIEGCQIVRDAFEYSREGYDYRESRKPWKRLNWLQKANGGRISLKKKDALGLLSWTMMSFYPSKTPTKCIYLVRLCVFHRSLRLCLYFFTLFSFYSWSSKISTVPSSISRIFLFPVCSYLCLNFTSWALQFDY